MQNQDRASLLKKALHQSLHEALADTPIDGVGMMGLERTTILPNVARPRANIQGLGLLSSERTQVSRSLAFSAAAALSGARPNVAFGLTTDDILVAAAERRMLDRAKEVAIAQRALAEESLHRKRYNESLITLFQRGLGVSAQGVGLISPEVARMEESVQKDCEGTLEALGSSLRKKDSPYLDVSELSDSVPTEAFVRKTRGGVTEPFPEKLHRMLREVEETGDSDIVSFFAHGRAFAVHNPDRFVSEIMPKYFKQSRLSSFQRQLNLYGFTRITSGPDVGGYYHELFLKGRPNHCLHMRRVGIPQGGDRRKLNLMNKQNEPDFYQMSSMTTK